MGKALVAYFSASGVTAKVAQNLAQAVEADICEIKPQVLYTEADLDWRDRNSRSSVEMNNKSFRPPIADCGIEIESYDTVYLGFPIWWYVAPTVVNTFLENCDFSGKKIIVFATSGGSGFGNTIAELKPSVSEDVQFVQWDIINPDATVQQLKEGAEALK